MKKKRELYFPYLGNMQLQIRKMKLTLILTLLVFVTFGNSFSQVKLSLQLKKATMQEVIETIEDQTEYIFLYKDEIFDQKQKYSIDFNETLFEEVLKSICETANVDYEIRNDRQIILKEKVKDNLIVIQQNKKSITGIVTGDDGQPIPGVSIIVKGTTIGVTSDIDGNYSLEIPDNAETLIFSFIGMETQEIPINGQNSINVVLLSANLQLEETVVIAYGTKKKRDVIGSVTKVDGAKLANSATGSFEQSLQGRAAGVQVSSGSGLPGQSPQIKVRGISSINSGTDPLWIIDGVGGGKGMINPNDIESIEILKDAAATAVYGARASNGVIIVTTKKGKKGKPQFNLSVHSGITQLPDLDIGYIKDNKTLFEIMDIASNNYSGADWDIANDPMSHGRFSGYSETTTRDQALATNTNWNDLLTQQGSYNDINFSVSNGSEYSNTYASVNYRKDEGYFINYDYERLSGRINTEFIHGNFTYGFRMFSEYSKKNSTATGLKFGDTWMPAYSDVNPTGYWNAETGSNPLANADDKYKTNANEGFGLNATLYARLKIPQVEGLTLIANYNPSIGQSKTNNYTVGLITQSNSTLGNTGNETIIQSKGYIVNTYANYNQTFANDHNIDVLIGFEQGASTSTWTGLSGINLLGAFHELEKSEDPITGQSYLKSEGYRRNYFGRFDYKFKDRYLIGASVGREGTSKFEEEHRWGTFYSLSAGWIISDEEFMPSVDWISILKLRGSLGQTGNDQIPQITETIYATNGSTKNYIGIPNTYITNYGNSLATWETTTSIDFGLDFGFLKNRLNGSIAYYQQDIADLLLSTPLPLSSGLAGDAGGQTTGVFVANIGDMVNKGLEVEVAFAAINNKDFKWNLGGNVATNKNEIIALDPATDATGKGIITGGSYGPWNITKTGGSIGQWFMPDFAGVDPDKGFDMIYEVDKNVYAETGETVKTGNLIPASATNIKNNRMIQEGKTSLPTYYGGFYNDFKYKNFDFGIQWTFQGGNYIYNDMGVNSRLVGDDGGGAINESLLEESWKNPGDIAKYPKLMMKDRHEHVDVGGNIVTDIFRGATTACLEKGNYVRLRELQLGYSLPDDILGKLKISQLRFYASATNLLTITSFSGVDPEFALPGSGALSGINARSYGAPAPKIFTLGLNLKF